MKNNKKKQATIKYQIYKKPIKPNKTQDVVPEPQTTVETTTPARPIRCKRYGVKTIAKSMGLKSTLVTNDRIIVTSFVKSKTNAGNKNSNVEKITDITGENAYGGNQQMFSTNVSAKEISISSATASTKFCNPATNMTGMDYIRAKSQIEQKYFGKNFTRDNVHIQIAHNIMDIKKSLSSCINNIVYAFYNLNRSDELDSVQKIEDLIGTLRSYANFDQLTSTKRVSIEKLLNSLDVYSNYFGAMFTNAKEISGKTSNDWKKLSSLEKEKYAKLARKENYKILQLLSYARQMVFHDEYANQINDSKQSVSSEASIFNVENAITNRELLIKLDEIFQKAIGKLNASFVDNAQKNCFILSKIYDRCNNSEIIKMYYNFSIYKDSQILGINVKKLREIIFDKYVPETKETAMNDSNYRSRFYSLTNLLLFNVLKDSTTLNSFVNELRRCGTQADKNGDVREEAKVAVYEKYAEIVWKTASCDIQKLMSLCKQYNEDKNVPFRVNQSDIETYAISAKNIDYFVKFIFFLTNFLDGKEINILLCALINKFDNIADILETIEQSDYSLTFADDYNFFKQSRKIAADIRIAKNVGRMKCETDVTKAMVKDAVVMLNTTGDEIPKFMELIYHELPDGTVDKDNKDNSLRNFIINNIIKTKWFFYVAKYCNLKECAKIMQNIDIIKFVLKDIPEKQIDRYYKRINESMGELSLLDKINVVAKAVHDFSLYNMLNGMNSVHNKNIEEQNKGIIQLYLTIAYLFTKSMVQVNTRFSLAFSCLERDTRLHFNDFNQHITNDYLRVTEKFIDEDKATLAEYQREKSVIKAKNLSSKEAKPLYEEINKIYKKMHYSKRVLQTMMVNNLAEIRNILPMLKEFRNNVQHVNVVNNMGTYMLDAKADSYYGMYCYILQSLLADKMIAYKAKDNDPLQKHREAQRLNEAGRNLKETLTKYRTYNKDFMWTINMPFAYNLPRYKNLSCEYLFYDGEYKQDDAQKPTR